MLHGSDLPDGTKSVTIVVKAVREAPEGFGAPIIIEFEKPVFGKTAWAANKTNTDLIREIEDDEKKLIGRKITLLVVPARNPETGKIVRSLSVKPAK